MSMELQGFDDLKNDLTNMAAELQFGKGVDRALESGAVPIEEQMIANTAKDPKIISGDLHSAIHIGKVKKSRSQGKRITIGVHRKDWNNDEYYPAFLEFGHGGPGPAPAHPYARPAFDTRQEEAYARMRDVLREELNK